MSHVGHVSNVASELSAREAARRVLEDSPNFRNLEQVVKGSSSWQRPKLLTAVLKDLVRQPLDRCAATATGAGRLLEVLRTQRLEVNIFHYNSAINVCSKCSAWDLALAFLQHMPCISIQPDVVSYNAVMGACGEASRWQVVLSLSNLPLVNLISFNTAIKAFDRSGHWQLALYTLKLLPLAGFQPDLVTYGSVMNALAAGGRWHDVGRLLEVMFTDRLDPDLLCFTSFIKACGQAKKWMKAMEMLDAMLEAKVIPDHVAYSSAITTCDSPQWLVALSLFHSTSRPDVAVFNAMLMPLSRHWKMAMHLLQHMPKMRVKSDEITRTLASESYSQGTQWASSMCLWNLLRLPAPSMPSQWRDGLEMVRCRSLNPELASQVARCFDTERWHLALSVFNQMDLVAVQRDDRIWSDTLAACQKANAWRLVLNALNALPAVTGTSGAYQAAILACENRKVALELFLRYQKWMTPAAVCGTMARLLVNDPNIIHGSMVVAYEALDESWSPQDISLLWWACAILGVNSRALCSKLKELSLASMHLMSMEGLLALAVGASATACEVSGKDGLDVLSSVQDEISLRLTLGIHLSYADILGVISACKLAASVQRQLEEKTKKLLHQLGSRKDQRSKMSMKSSRTMELKAKMLMVTLSDDASPAVVLNLMDQAVLYKPAGWEVYDQHVPKQLRSFAIESFPKKAILQDMESNCGFLHRLDVPNSGLLLLATSYAAYYDLQLQLAAGQLIRDYLVLVHGVASHRSLLARLQRQAERSIAGGQGKSSCTKVLKIAKDIRDQSAFTLMHLQIVTGRQHQIRCHLAHVGHPVVCDGLYSSFETFHSDCCWVPRNWLHRCRLAFQRFQGTTKTPCAQQVSMALPRDLADTLSPKLTAAAEEWQKNGFGLG